MIYIYSGVLYILIRTYADLTFFFLSEVQYTYDLFQLLCVLSSVFIFVFPPGVIFRSRVIGACPVTTDCIVAMSSCEHNNRIFRSYFLGTLLVCVRACDRGTYIVFRT